MELDGADRKTGPCLDTVRALHQTVVALRAALERSRSEILELKSKAWPADELQDTLKSLSIENHLLRRAVIEKGAVVSDKTEDQATESLKAIEDEFKDDRVVKTELAKETCDALTEDNHHSRHCIPKSVEDVVDKKAEAEKCVENEQIAGNLKHNISKVEEFETKRSQEVKATCQEAETTEPVKKQVKIVSPKDAKDILNHHNLEAKISIKTETFSARKISKSLESLTIINTPLSSSGRRQLTISKTLSFSHIDYKEESPSEDTAPPMDRRGEEDGAAGGGFEAGPREMERSDADLDQDQDEVDDIELIFTTDETRPADLKGHLVSIGAGEGEVEGAAAPAAGASASASGLLRCPGSDLEQFDISDRELDDDVFGEGGDTEDDGRGGHRREELKPSGCRKSLSQMYASKSDNSINNEEKSLKSCCSYQDSSFENKSLEKDESFDRFEERVRIVETDISKCGIQDVEYCGIRRNTCPNPLQYRPLLHREALSKGFSAKKSRPILAHSNALRRESGAQTDISAIPGSAWRSESSLANKAKLSDNFTTLPSKFPLPGSRLRLSEKTVEARRVLLSDLGFTSMVPELSRSADHLCPAAGLRPPSATAYGQFLRTPDLYSPGYALNSSQRFTWTATTATPSEGSHSRYSSLYPLSPPAPARRCSAPVSPSRRAQFRTSNPGCRVRFANGSLPELRTDWASGGLDHGDSTDSLVDEAETFLRRSIDCIAAGRDMLPYSSGGGGSESRRAAPPRRASAPEPSADNVPPAGWQPFLPRAWRDLKPDHWVKVIAGEGRVRGGRVRYVGPAASHPEPLVGVQLATPDGTTDGTLATRRYFQCEPYHGIFVPFKKVIMGWRP